MNKKQRQLIWNKSNGLCWYCGNELPKKGWHADHVDPVYRFDNKQLRPQNDNIGNLVPACAACNMFKGVFSIESFRQELELQITRARKYSSNFRVAERFGLVEVKEQPIVFWFERESQG